MPIVIVNYIQGFWHLTAELQFCPHLYALVNLVLDVQDILGKKDFIIRQINRVILLLVV